MSQFTADAVTPFPPHPENVLFAAKIDGSRQVWSRTYTKYFYPSHLRSLLQRSSHQNDARRMQDAGNDKYDQELSDPRSTAQ